MEEDWGLCSESFKTSILSWKQTRHLALYSAKCSYQQALHLAPWEANIYTDIAITLDLISSLNNDSESGVNSWYYNYLLCIIVMLPFFWMFTFLDSHPSCQADI